MLSATETLIQRQETVEPEPGIPAELPLTIIERRPGWRLFDLRELWRYRELLVFLTWRDIKVRYRQTVLGAAWAVLQPFATMLVFTVVFGRVASGTDGEIAYPLFVFSGYAAWLFFANSITAASQSVVGNQNLVTKIYFPRLIIPIGAVGPYLLDFAICLAVLIGLMTYFKDAPGWPTLFVPVAILGLILAAIGVGALLAALTVAYRDFRHAIPFMVQLWMFATPTIYVQADLVGPRWQPFLPLNPAHGLIKNFRLAMLGEPLDGYAFAVSASVSIGLFLVGCLYFRRAERSFADVI